MKNIFYIISLIFFCGSNELFAQIDATIIPKYNRKDYGNWIDVDKNGLNTRQEVLKRYKIYSSDSTTVKWICVYSGIVVTDPSKLDIDHTVPLKEAHLSGSYAWSKEKKRDYYNYLNNNFHLRSVTASENRSKSDKDPTAYMPKYNKCEYLLDWIETKAIWNLNYDEAERKFIFTFLRDSCDCY